MEFDVEKFVQELLDEIGKRTCGMGAETYADVMEQLRDDIGMMAEGARQEADELKEVGTDL